jgi:Zn-dependent protease/predicted transcriptional regulator
MSSSAHTMDRRVPGASAGRPPRRSGGIFSSTITLGRVAGVEIGLNWTWVIVFGLIVWSLSAVQFPDVLPGRSREAYAAMGATATVTFFVCLILHELGHAIQARREGIEIEGITLWLFGGVAKIVGEFPSAGAELRMAAAGPLVSLVLGVAFVGAAAVWPGAGAVPTELTWLGYINLVLLVFNLVPAMPLDGGRVLRAALWWRSRDLATATHQAARVGSVLATAIVLVGVLEAVAGTTSGIWLAVLGWFILEAGRAEEQRVQTRHALTGVSVEMLMTRTPVTVGIDQTLAEVADQIAGTSRHGAYPVLDDGAVVGLLPLHALAQRGGIDVWGRRVRDYTVRADAVPQFSPETPAMAAFDELAESGAGRGVVVDHGRLTGIISMTDLARALALGRPV